MSTDNSARAGTVIPSHGVGRLTPFPPGVSGNPGGRPAGLREVQRLAREKSITALKALIGLVEDVDEKGLPNQDGRIVVVAAQTILTWAYGKPPDYDPREDKPGAVVDTSNLTTDEKRLLLAILRKGVLRPADEAPPTTEIEGQAER